MIQLKEYKYSYKKRDKETKKIDQKDKSIPVSGTYIAELKKIYKDGIIKHGYKSYLFLENEKNLKKMFCKIDNFIMATNAKLESWEPKFFLSCVKKTNGLRIKRPVEKKIKRKPKKKEFKYSKQNSLLFKAMKLRRNL